MHKVRLSTGYELGLDGDLLGVLEALYREVTLKRQLKVSFEDMMREIEGLVDQMPDEERRQVLPLGREQELRRRFPHLTDTPGRRLELEREHRLHRVDDEKPGLDPADLLEDALDARLGEQVERRVADAEPIAARLDLVLRLLAGGVEHGPDAVSEIRGCL